MNRVRKTMWQLMALLCLVVLVTGCGKKVVKGVSTSDQYAQSEDTVKTYGQMRSPATIMKDGLVDSEKMQMGESTINPTVRESDSNQGLASNTLVGKNADNSLLTASLAGQGLDGSMTDESFENGSLDVVTMSLASTRSVDPAGLVNGVSEADEYSGDRQSENRLPQKNVVSSRNLGDVHFDFDSWRLSGPARETLEANAEWLKAHPHEHITIEGHCDERGTQSYNYALGEKRASMVQQYLSFLGVPLEQLYVASFGKDRPACLTMTADCFDQNRRAHFNASVNMVSKQPDAITR